MLKQNLNKLILSVLTVSLFIACSDDDNAVPPIDPMETAAEFTVTIENVIIAKDYFDAGTTGLIMPGMSESYSFNAGKGNYFNFATMYVQSNDLFFAPTNEKGIALFDESGVAVTGDITSLVQLWDAGTEVNQEPGTGVDQAPRQTGPNTGADENGTVELITDVTDGFTYASVNEAIKVSLAHDGGTLFTLTIENLTNALALGSPLAPGVWVLNSAEQSALFTKGEASSAGLEAIAEDGNNSILESELSSKSGYVSPFAPGAYAVGSENALFSTGMVASAGLEALAEDGNPTGLTTVFNTPVGASDPGPIFPGGSYSFTFTAKDGDALSFATMLVQSNDWFVAADAIKLFTTGTAISGDITSEIELYDAGTEVDEFAGAGSNQAPRQSAANTGDAENGTVEEETEAGSQVPTVSGLIKVTITSN